MKRLLPGREYIVAIPGPDFVPEEHLSTLLGLFERNGAKVELVVIHGLTAIEVVELVVPHDPTEWKVSRAVAQHLLTREDITIRDGLDNALRFVGETDG